VQAQAAPAFRHGVASGDPLMTRVIIWTRVTPTNNSAVPVTWRVSSTADMANIVTQGTASAEPTADWTVKIDVRGLRPGNTYYYQFEAAGVTSPIGRTRTLPHTTHNRPFSLAVFSCSNYEKGYFNAYGEAAKQDDLFGVLHLGDYTYEYGVGGYVTPALAVGLVSEPRRSELVPTTETVLLSAYRQRLALYRSDPQLQALHAHCPWMVVWDDHESTNDSWTGGAQNHTPGTEGDWQFRKRSAIRAWLEWMPVRAPTTRFDAQGNPNFLYRSFDFGQLARVIMVDTRLAGRDQQLSGNAMVQSYGIYGATGNWAHDVVGGRPRSLLGAAQETWLDNQLSGSPQTWQIIGNQVLCFYQIAADFLNAPGITQAQQQEIIGTLDSIFGPGAGQQFGQLGAVGLPNPETVDTWTGYPSAKARLYASLLRARNPIMLAGDSHNAWAANLAIGTTAVAPEFGTASVSSPGFEEIFPTFAPALLEGLMLYSSQARSTTDKLAWTNLSRRGFLRLNVAPSAVTATFVMVSTAFSTNYTVTSQAFTVAPGARRIAGT
jgi:alkaline phosphatase D